MVCKPLSSPSGIYKVCSVSSPFKKRFAGNQLDAFKLRRCFAADKLRDRGLALPISSVSFNVNSFSEQPARLLTVNFFLRVWTPAPSQSQMISPGSLQ